MRMTIHVPDDLRERMRNHETSWSAIAAKCFEREVARGELLASTEGRARAGSLRYASEKLGSAMDSLRGIGSIQDRLIGAVQFSLIHVPVHALPGEISGQFKKMMEDLVRVEPRGEEGQAAATISRMSDFECSEAASIVEQTERYVEHEIRDLGLV